MSSKRDIPVSPSFSLSECQFGFIGAGKIANAILHGLINYGDVPPSQISLSAPSNNNLPAFKQLGCHTTHNNEELFLNCPYRHYRVLLICVKPYIAQNCIRTSKQIVNLNHFISDCAQLVVISVLAGTSLSTIRKLCHLDNEFSKCVNFARIMPNTACSIGKGICGISRDIEDQEFDKLLISVFSPLGFCQIVPEAQLNIICGLGGSGIAFVYNIIQAMTDGALKMGLPRNVATSFAANTVLGAASMVIETKRHPIELRDEVTSPGGTTIYGLHAYEKAGVSSGMMDAIEAATKRANEFSEK